MEFEIYKNGKAMRTIIISFFLFTISFAQPFTNNYCVNFDGTDYLTAPDHAAYDFGTSDFSISLWVKGVNSPAYLLVKYASLPRWRIICESNYARAFFNVSGKTVAANGTGLNQFLVTDGWHNIIVTGDRDDSLRVYVDGVKQGIVSLFWADNLNSANLLTMGANYDGTSGWNGKIDEVAFFSYVLSQPQITAIYNSGVPTDLTFYSPTAWFRFEEGGGTTTQDEIEGITGTFQASPNAPSWFSLTGETIKVDAPTTNVSHKWFGFGKWLGF